MLSGITLSIYTKLLILLQVGGMVKFFPLHSSFVIE
jgi:hypothetical protein